MPDSLEPSAAAALAAYDLEPPVEIFALPRQGASNTSAGIRTGAGTFVWKTYSDHHDPGSVLYEHRLLVSLDTEGLSFCVPVPIPARGGEGLVRGPFGWGSLTRWFPGETIDPSDLDQVELMGAATGEIHTALARRPATPRPGWPLFRLLFDFPPPARDPFTVTPARLHLSPDPANDSPFEWWRDEAPRIKAFVDGPFQALPWQLCHNDITPFNMLVDAGRVSALLDFEFATPAPRALDVAMGLRMTMRVWENPEPWEALQRFGLGYARWIRMAEAEVLALPQLIRLRIAVVVLWWLGRMSRPEEAAMVVRGMEYLRTYDRWLQHNEQRFVHMLTRAFL